MEEPQLGRLARRIADALSDRSIVAEVIEPGEHPGTAPMVLGGSEVWFKLTDEHINVLHVVGSLEEDSHLARYLVGELRPTRETFAELKPKRKGLFGLGDIGGYEWKGRGLAAELKTDPFLTDMLVQAGYTDISIWPEGTEHVAIHPVHTMDAKHVVDFLRPGNVIARHLRRVVK